MRTTLIMALATALAACATPYQPRNTGTMGYFDQDRSDGRWEIGFNAQRQTDWSTIDDYLRRHAVEVAKSRGWKGYVELSLSHDIHGERVNRTYGYTIPSAGMNAPPPGTADATPSQQVLNYQIPFSYRQGRMIIAPRP